MNSFIIFHAQTYHFSMEERFCDPKSQKTMTFVKENTKFFLSGSFEELLLLDIFF